MQQEAKRSNPPTTVPPGFVVNEELVINSLYNKIMGRPLPCGLAVKECNIYGDNEPWEIWDIHGGPHSKRDEDLYFFTELQRKGVNDSRFVRKVGLNGGAWKAENSAKIIQDRMTKRSIGIKKRFRYENSGSRHNGCWFMFEYSLHQSLLSVDNYVICRIQRKDGNRESENVEKRGEIVIIKDEQSLPRTQGGPSETVGEAKESTKIVPNSHTDWAVCFAEELLQNQPMEVLEEKEIEMVPNMLHTHKWLD